MAPSMSKFSIGVRDNYSRQVAEIRSEAFLDGWLAFLKELGVPEDNPSWTNVALALEYPEPPAPDLPMILRVFDEEEYVNRLEEDEVTQLADEAGQTATKGACENAALDLSPEP